MSKFVVLVIVAFIFTPFTAGAVSDQQMEYAQEISQQWVDQHNNKLIDLVKKAAQRFFAQKKAFVVASLHTPELVKKQLKLEMAADFGIPDQVAASDGVTVNLMGLYRTLVQFVPGGEQVFVTAEYYDELDSLHTSADIYMKIGQIYYKFFHGEGYPGSAKIVWLDSTSNNSPVFFEIGRYGGGSQVQKTLYALDKKAVGAISQTLFNNPEKIQPEDYIQDKLDWTVWLDGQTSYQDLARDGTIEVLNLSRVTYPVDLKMKLKEKYGFVNTDFIKSFRKALSVYQWNDKKQQFDDLGDYYY